MSKNKRRSSGKYENDDSRGVTTISHPEQEVPIIPDYHPGQSQYYADYPAPEYHSRPRDSGSAPKQGESSRTTRRSRSRARSPGRGQERPATDSGLLHREFDNAIYAAGDIHLFAQRLDEADRPFAYDIYLSTLQRMVIFHLQRQLADIVKEVHNYRRARYEVMEKAKQLLADYSTAIRDYDLMAEKAIHSRRTGEPDPFQITTEHTLGLLLMRDAGLIPGEGKDVKAVDGKKYRHWGNILPGYSRTERYNAASLAQIRERLWMGIVGGLALIVPMIIMVLKKDLLTTLLTTSAATLLFAGVLAIAPTDIRGETVLASVAAYAAVLVVFVGASS